MRAGKSPHAIHNNCSGKHAGMLAAGRASRPRSARLRAARPSACSRRSGESFQRLAESRWKRMRSVSTAARCRPSPCRSPRSPRLRAAREREGTCARAGKGGATGSWTPALPRRISSRATAASTPSSCAGSATLAFVKGGAEGVHCAALPALGIGIAVKVDDGAKRGAEMALAVLLAKLVANADQVLASQLAGEMRTWRGVRVGVVEPAPALKAAVRALPRQSAVAAVAQR